MTKLISAAKPVNAIGLSDKEVERFSFVRLIAAQASPNDAAVQRVAGFEREVSTAAANALGIAPKGMFVPIDVLRAPFPFQRALNVGTPTAGGNTVQTDVVGSSFIEMLTNRLMVKTLGATVLTDLSGNVAIPRQTAASTAYWVAEGGAPTESDQAFDQVTLTPHTAGAFTDYTRRLLLQSSIDVEAFVRLDLATRITTGIDLAAINGSGSSNQPRGILNTSGIGSVAGGTNGAAPTLANIVALESAVAAANADVGSLAYLTNAKVRGKLKTVDVSAAGAGKFLWGDAPTVQPGIGNLNGYRAGVSNQVPSNLVKGTSGAVCSAIIFGNWADLLIGMWSGLDVLVDPYSNSTTGTVRVVAFQDIDIALRQAASFAAMVDALTS